MKKAMNSNLRFPGKIIVIQDQPNMPYEGNILMIADTGNNWVLIVEI